MMSLPVWPHVPSRGLSVQWGLCPGGAVSVQEGVGSVQEGMASVQGGLCWGDLPDRDTLYGDEWTVLILLECFLVIFLLSHWGNETTCLPSFYK